MIYRVRSQAAYRSPVLQHFHRAYSAYANYYKELGVEKGSTQEEIKKAFRRQARIHHPDVNKGDKEKEDKFKKIVEAYEVLSNEKKRTEYDQERDYSSKRPPPGATFYEEEFDMDLGDIFSHFGFGSFGPNRSGNNEFNDFFQFRSQRRRKPKKKKKANGSKITVSSSISFMEAVTGTTRDIIYSADVQCEPCNGTGNANGKSPKICKGCNGSGTKSILKKSFIMQQQCGECNGSGEVPQKPCNLCSGSGKVKKRQTARVDIPPGINEGEMVKLKGKGNAGSNGGLSGDLLVAVQILSHPIFTRDGLNIHSNFKLRIDQAVFGTTVSVPTVDGEVTVYVKSGTTHGEKATLYGKGIKGNGRGDHILTWKIDIPDSKNLSEKQRKLLQEFANEEIAKQEKE